jgi:hypothetical protein
MSSHESPSDGPTRPRDARLDAYVENPTPYDILLGGIDDVIAEWRALVQIEPWMQLAPARLVDALPEILPRVFRLARAGASQIDATLSEFIAKAHGYVRRADAVPLSGVADEWNHVKRACWTVLMRQGVAPAEATAVMERIDALVDDAVGFSLRGYYAPELDELRGRGLERRGGPDERRKGTGDRRGADGGNADA